MNGVTVMVLVDKRTEITHANFEDDSVEGSKLTETAVIALTDRHP